MRTNAMRAWEELRRAGAELGYHHIELKDLDQMVADLDTYFGSIRTPRYEAVSVFLRGLHAALGEIIWRTFEARRAINDATKAAE